MSEWEVFTCLVDFEIERIAQVDGLNVASEQASKEARRTPRFSA